MSKKRGKTNKQVKRVFDGLGFDQGIAKLEEELLSELSIFFGIKPKSFTKDDMLRAIRTHWSEASVNVRKAILNFIMQRITQENFEHDYEQRVEKITEIAHSFECNDDEISQLIDIFKEQKSKKITTKKIKTSLEHIRFKTLQQKLKEKSGVWVVGFDGEGEFIHSYKFELFGETFHKELLTSSQAIEQFQSLDFDSQVFNLLLQKEKARAEQSKQISLILDTLPQKHPYLSKTDIVTILKSLSNEDSLDHPSISIKILRKIFDNYVVTIQNQYINLKKLYECEFLGEKISYHLHLDIEEKTLYSQIFYGEMFDFDDDFKAKHLENIAHIKLEIDALFDEMQALSSEIEIDENTIKSFIKTQLIEDINNRHILELRSKVSRRILYHFQEYLLKQKQKKHKEELLKKTVRDFKNLFPIARGLKRKLIFHMGPTNSGKTYAALQKLKHSDSGYYLAPLRLLALEGYESLKSSGICCSLITGEEEIVDEESTHISSTIEMLNFGFDVDCCVIDEVQMISDKDRGWAWVNAIIGAGAKEVYMTGSANALPAIKEIAAWLDEELEVVEFKRKNPLKVLDKPIDLEDISPQTALIAFSRKEVLALKQRLTKKYKISVVYGNLSPEVRREEARRFREGESQILIATDAISMGLNLPIKTILFTKDSKFDGEVVRELNSDEITQIAGRAGRYGMEEVGFVGGINAKIHKLITKNIDGKLKSIFSPFTVMANLEHIRLVSTILDTQNLYEILDFFANNMKFEGPFVAKKLEQMMEISHITDSYELDLEVKYHLSCAPVSINSPYIESKFHEYIVSLEKGQKIPYIAITNLPSHANSAAMLLKIEDRVKEISLYLWLSFKFPHIFSDAQKAIQARSTLNRFIENSLKFSQFIKRCKRCGRAMEFDFKFKVCEHCYNRNKRVRP